MNEQASRARFLTDGDKSQRAYLSGRYKPETNNAEYQVRSKIRSRIEGALFELKFISKNISNRDLKKIFENWESDASEYPESVGSKGEHYRIEVPQQIAEIEAIIGMAYRGYQMNGMDANEFVKSIVGNAIRKAEADRQGVRPQDVSLELNLGEIEVQTDPLNKWEQDMTLTKGEYQELHDRLSEKLDREISVSEMDDLIDKHLVESDGE